MGILKKYGCKRNKMTRISRLFVIVLSVVLLSSCSNISQNVPGNTLSDHPARNTPFAQGEKEDAVEGKMTEVQTPKPNNSQYEQVENEEDTVAQVINRVNEQITDNTGSYFLIQFRTTLNSELSQRLIQAGIVLYDPLENNVYQAYISVKALPFLEELLKRSEIISITTIPPQGKIKPPLNDPNQVNPLQSYQITVQFFDVPTTAEKEMLEKIMVVDEYAEGVTNFAQGHALGNDLRSIAELSFVKLIEEVVPASGGGSQ
jgi:hypothetical protein